MKLLEYEAKELLVRYGCAVPPGQVVKDAAELRDIQLPAVVKAQIPKGGRGKAGGIKLVRTANELQAASQLLGRELLGCKVEALLVEEVLAIKRELYLAIGLNRAAGSLVLMAHRQGGVDIEEASRTAPLWQQPLEAKPTSGIIKKLGKYFGLNDAEQVQLANLIAQFYTAYTSEDALLVEINPLVITASGRLVCADAKIELDDAAAFRHANWQFADKPASSQFVVLNQRGQVASMANGAGLAMATIDAIQAAGLTPANFFDVGGGTNAAGMVAAFEKIAALPEVRAVVINIFGGITRCDEVAEAILEAQRNVKKLPKLYVRLTGTNEAEGKNLLASAGVATLPSLAACVAAAAQEAKHV